MYVTFEQQQNELVEWMNGAQSALTNILSTLVLDDNSATHSQLQVSSIKLSLWLHLAMNFRYASLNRVVECRLHARFYSDQ